jgi:hypothetical protein
VAGDDFRRATERRTWHRASDLRRRVGLVDVVNAPNDIAGVSDKDADNRAVAVSGIAGSRAAVVSDVRSYVGTPADAAASRPTGGRPN